ncbi:deaminase/reductase [Streptomonospora alba]|uniref:Deaminase/reductase n=1 Tax=Streptomonospora alba TaxID=183763 RepID=A0A0C2FBZ9_9ACTN|nr:dihydrofolate reductase family protein [Streptomonospora alba]KIH96624.1 deaminase/reductase [Streptomonospora alba]
MRIVLTDFMSLDGVVQAPGGAEEDTDGGFAHGGWSGPYFDTEAMSAFIDGGMENAEALLFGRRTWRVMADAWPARAGDDPFADRMNALPKHVASRTLAPADMEWNSTLLPADDVFGAVDRLRKEGEGDIHVWGSSDFARQLVAHDLVDEYRMMIEPVLLGGGKRIFPEDGRARPLRLVSTRTASTGVLLCVYRPDSAG